MLKRLACFLLLLSMPMWAAWEKQGTLSGNITDVEFITWSGRATDLAYVATSGSGVFSTDESLSWVEANGTGGTYPLPDFNVNAIASFPGQAAWLIAACQNGVFITNNQGSEWTNFSPDPVEISSAVPVDVAVTYDGSEFQIFLATLGAGVLHRHGTWGSWSSWALFNGGDMDSNQDYYVLSVGAQWDGSQLKLLAGTQVTPFNANSGHLYYYSDKSWLNVNDIPQNVSVPAISYRYEDYALAAVGKVSTSPDVYGGVWYSTDGHTFTELNPSGNMPTDEGFQSLDYIYRDSSQEFMGIGGTTRGLYRLPDIPNAATLLSEDFKTWPPVDWTVKNNGGDCVWNSTYTTEKPNYTGGGDYAATADSDHCGDKTTMDTELITPQLDLSDVSTAAIHFRAAYRNEPSLSGFFQVAVTTDGGSNWDLLLDWQEDHSPTGPGEEIILDLTPYAGESSVYVRFHYFAPGWDWYVQIDEVRVVTATYLPFSFVGTVTGVGVARDPAWGKRAGIYCQVLFGGPGKGPFLTDACSTATKPVAVRSGILDYQISDIAVSNNYGKDNPNHPDPDNKDFDIFAASRIAGLYKNKKEFLAETGERGYFTRMIGNPDQPGAPDVISLGVSPHYEESGSVDDAKQTLFAGTMQNGILKSTDGGRSWTDANGLGSARLPMFFPVTDIALSPGYDGNTDQNVYAAFYGRGIYKSADGGASWELLGPSSSGHSKQVTSIDLHPSYDPVTYECFFVGCRQDGSRSTVLFCCDQEWSGKSYFGSVTSIRVPNDPKVGGPVIYIGTEEDGVLYSVDLGLSFGPFPDGSILSGHYIHQVLESPAYEDAGQDLRMLIAAVKPNPKSGHPGGFYWYSSSTESWDRFVTNISGYPNIVSVAFDPNFWDKGNVFCGHYNQKIYAGYMNLTGGTMGWVQAGDPLGGPGFYTTPARINGLAVDPGDPNVVLAATDDMGTFLSLDGGMTFRPWSKGLTYLDGSVTRVVERVLSVVITDTWNGDIRTALCGLPEPQGIYYNDYNPLSTDLFTSWVPATLNFPTRASAGDINEIRYLNLSEDLRASDTFNGDWHSSDIGGTWDPVDLNLTVGLTDVSYPVGLTKKENSTSDRGLTSFTWGCSSGTVSSTGQALAFSSSKRAPGWEACGTTGLDTTEDFRAILEITSGTVLLGSKDSGGGTWIGMWRSEDVSVNCSTATWQASNQGLPKDPPVYAIQELDSGDILAGVDGSSGGVYMSDGASDGYAWVQVNGGFTSRPGTLDLTTNDSGDTIYTGMSEDGIYASDTVIEYTGLPAAYFTVNSESCDSQPITFTDRSAGRVTSWSWDFGDSGTSSDQHPTHTYTLSDPYVSEMYSPQLTAYNAYGNDTYSRSHTVKPELELNTTDGNHVQVEKTGSGTEIRIFWGGIIYETGFQVYGSMSASSGHVAVGDPLPTGTTEVSLNESYIYYRIQVLSDFSTYVCGSGPIGGSW